MGIHWEGSTRSPAGITATTFKPHTADTHVQAHLDYLQYGRDDGINVESIGNLSAHLGSEIGIFRAIDSDRTRSMR